MADDRFAPFYDRGFAERVFTSAEIERQGRYLLYRALNIGRAIAFVGSGLSAGYGHPLWSELLADAATGLNKSPRAAKRSVRHEFELISNGVLVGESDLQPLRAHMLEVLSRSRVKRLITRKIKATETKVANPDQQAFQLATDAYNSLGRKRAKATSSKYEGMLPAEAMFALGIKRVVTTNYDLVLEDTLTDKIGYEFESNSKVSTGKRVTEERARSAVLNVETTAALVDFAVRGSPFEHEVFHLHGRADDADSLVVTERDYQRTYLRNTPNRYVLDEALHVAFAGNPIIFVGMGMVEADLLRPLRRFVSNPEMRINHNVIALLPAEQGAERRTFAALNLYLRYGVHVIFYGLDEVPGDVAFDPAPWLTNGPRRPDAAWLFRSISSIEHLCDALDGKLTTLREHHRANKGYSYLAHARHAASVLQAPSLLAAVDRAEIAVRSALGRRRLLAKHIDSLKRALRAIDRAVRTRALSDALIGLAADRDEWWKSWLRLPAPRRYIHGIDEFVGGEWQPLNQAEVPSSNLAIERPDTPLRAIRFATHNIGRDPSLRKLARDIGHALSPESAPTARVIVAHGGIGSGRGSLFGLLHDTLTTERQWQLFVNASYSMEYSSVVDGLTDFVWRLTTKVDDENPFKGVAKQRVEAIRFYLRTLQGHQGKRLLIVLHGLELLFHSDGRPKNEEIISALSEFLKYPVDLVLIVQSDRAEAIFGQDLPTSGVARNLRLGKSDRLSRREQTEIADKIDETPPQDIVFASTCFAIPRLTTEQVRDWRKMELTSQEDSRFLEVLESEDLAYWRSLAGDRFVASCVLRAQRETFRLKGLDSLKNFDAAICELQSRASGDRHEEQMLLSIIAQYRKLGLEDWGLCEEILKHLAIISAPVEVCVLARCPRIKRFKSPNRSRIESACRRLVDLGLISEIGTRPAVSSANAAPGARRRRRLGPARYASHKSLQSLFYRKIGSPHHEFGDGRLFTVSLYSSHRMDLPAPTEEAYDFLIEVIEALSGRDADREGGDLRTDKQREDDVRCLRAAVSIVRAGLSFAVICRLGTHEDRDPKDRLLGRMEYVRLLLRWLIFRAGMLGDEVTKEVHLKDPSAERCPRGIRRWRLNALYQDEITWLYNECGVISLSQGNMYDAWALFHQARKSNAKVEGHNNGGPNALRIQLNLAISEIIRGNLRRADDYINEVRQATFNKNRLLYAVSTGYHGLVAHMRGRFDQASRHYLRSIALARGSSGEGRLLSILHRHHGDLLRDAGKLKEARDELRAARAEAETSRQQDQVHKTLVAQARLEIEDGALERGESQQVLRMITQAEKYADQMELHSLKVEAAAARALVFERQGESRLAGDAAIAGLSIATLHGMRLRVMTALCRVGRVASMRGHHKEAETVLGVALRLSEGAGYQLCGEQARRALNQI